MTTLHPYLEYKPAGIDWLGDVPAHWSASRMKMMFIERVEKGHPDEPLLAATQTKGVVPKDQYENRTVLAMKDLELLKLVRGGDFVISLRSFQGGIELAYYQGIISPAYTVLIPQSGVCSGYARRLFKSVPFIENLKLHVTGIRQGQNIDYDRLRRSEIPIPPLDEQHAIADFLDVADARITRYIAAKRRMIALLEEQKQAIINQAVTRGLDPDVPLKPSGVDWLGNIPAHWQMSRLKFDTSYIVDCLHATPMYSDNGQYPAIRTSDIIPGEVFTSTAKKVDQNVYSEWISRLKPMCGDILYSREGERYGIAAPVPSLPELCISQRMMVFRCKPEVCSQFIMWQLNAAHVVGQASNDVVGAAAPHVKVETIKNFFIVLPPFAEQHIIAEQIDRKVWGIADTTRRLRTEIDLMTEYRARLISDVVTGKLDVRSVELPALEHPS